MLWRSNGSSSLQPRATKGNITSMPRPTMTRLNGSPFLWPDLSVVQHGSSSNLSCSSFDLVVASGVLYHLIDPLLSLLDMMRVTGHIFVWSHFFNDAVMSVNDARRSLFTHETIEREQNGSHLTNHVSSSPAFCSKPSLCHCSKLRHLRWICDDAAWGARDAQEALACLW